MKVLLYSEGYNYIKGSGVGRALLHQMKALEMAGIAYTLDPNDNFDVIHINTVGLKSRKMARKAKRAGKAVIFHAHSTEEDFRNSFIFSNQISKLFKMWICSCYNMADVLITPTEYSKKLLLGYGIKKPIYAVSNGIDINFYKAKPSDREEFRKAFGFSDGDKVVMSAGLLFERKGILDFVKLAERLPNYKFIWFGSVSRGLIPRKVKKALDKKLPNLFFPGFLPADKLKQAYVGSDLFFFASKEETEGIVLLEALAAGSKILLRSIPAFSWVADKKEVYKSDNVVDMEQKITAILEGKLPDISANGRNKVLEKDLNNIGKQLYEVYTAAIVIASENSTEKLAVRAEN